MKAASSKDLSKDNNKSQSDAKETNGTNNGTAHPANMSRTNSKKKKKAKLMKSSSKRNDGNNSSNSNKGSNSSTRSPTHSPVPDSDHSMVTKDQYRSPTRSNNNRYVNANVNANNMGQEPEQNTSIANAAANASSKMRRQRQRQRENATTTPPGAYRLTPIVLDDGHADAVPNSRTTNDPNDISGFMGDAEVAPAPVGGGGAATGLTENDSDEPEAETFHLDDGSEEQHQLKRNKKRKKQYEEKKRIARFRIAAAALTVVVLAMIVVVVVIVLVRNDNDESSQDTSNDNDNSEADEKGWVEYLSNNFENATDDQLGGWILGGGTQVALVEEEQWCKDDSPKCIKFVRIRSGLNNSEIMRNSLYTYIPVHSRTTGIDQETESFSIRFRVAFKSAQFEKGQELFLETLLLNSSTLQMPIWASEVEDPFDSIEEDHQEQLYLEETQWTVQKSWRYGSSEWDANGPLKTHPDHDEPVKFNVPLSSQQESVVFVRLCIDSIGGDVFLGQTVLFTKGE